MKLAFKIELSIKLISTANNLTNWRTQYGRSLKVRKELQKALIEKLGQFRGRSLSTPAKVILSRIGKKLDKEDNLPMAFKTVKDVIAGAIIPGKKAGQADSSPLIEWAYSQEPNRGRPDGFQVEVYQEDWPDIPKSVSPLTALPEDIYSVP